MRQIVIPALILIFSAAVAEEAAAFIIFGACTPL